LSVRLLAAAAAVVALTLASCGEPAAPAPEHDVTTDAWYAQTLQQLTEINRTAEKDFRGGKPDEASALIEKGEPFASQLLAVPRPTLAAMVAASDVDSLYGRMLLSNRHYEWARFMFQKCLARWKYWKPETPDTLRRMAEAQSAIDECDRGMSHQ
jgi:hypothetical protein